MDQTANVNVKELNERIKEESSFIDLINMEMKKVIVGQKHLVESLLVGLLSDGHILLEGVPGLAKTLAISTLSSSIDAKFNRIQFTPDLLPADLLGTMIYSQQKEQFMVKKGPIFTNFVLADEINRSPAKVQSALLESMQERQITIGEESFKLDEPFLVLATQNPIEQEGTYPLPEAQVDRFMLKLLVGYSSREEEKEIMRRVGFVAAEEIRSVITPDRLHDLVALVNDIYMEEKLKDYIVDLVFATRKPEDYKIDVGPYIQYGASPRATIYMSMAAPGYAYLQGGVHVTPQDIKSIAPEILRHRILLTYEAEAEDITADQIITRVFDSVEVP